MWRKSSRSTGHDNACVEVADVSGAVVVRDSKDPDGSRLAFSRGEFGVLLEAIKRSQW